MHLFKQHAVKSVADVSALIPVIDYGPYFVGEPGSLEMLARDVRHACENVGFMYALNHGVPQHVIDAGFAASRRFHALPLEEKLKLRLNENNIGYMPMNASIQAASPCTRRRSRTRTKASSSATTAVPIIRMWWPA